MFAKKTNRSNWPLELATKLLCWFDENARDLPWRDRTNMTGCTDSQIPGDPYRIWVSETMLQQTQIATVIPYFYRWMERFPTIATLAESLETDVLRYWEGLGYYRRARMLHQSAKVLMLEYDGKIPIDLKLLLKLPGVGRYTAGAILSIAIGEKHPILEANTQRLYARLIALMDDPTTTTSQNRLWSFASEILPDKQVIATEHYPYGRLNQSLMELGSLICVPKNPLCELCPISLYCESKNRGLAFQIPVPRVKPTITPVHEVALLIYRPRKSPKCTKKDRKSPKQFIQKSVQNIDDKTMQNSVQNTIQKSVEKPQEMEFLVRRRPATERWTGLWDFPRYPISDHSLTEQEPHLRETLNRTVSAGYFESKSGRQIAAIDFSIDAVQFAQIPIATFYHSVTRYRITLDILLVRYIDLCDKSTDLSPNPLSDKNNLKGETQAQIDIIPDESPGITRAESTEFAWRTAAELDASPMNTTGRRAIQTWLWRRENL